MKHLKLFESFREEDIHAICKKYGIENYTINDDGSIDANGNVNLAGAGKLPLTKLPLKFRNVSGYFLCQHNQLTSLEGCPESVGGGFICQDNKITTFEHLPFSLGGDFWCGSNPIWEVWYLFFDYSKIELFNYYDIIQDGVIILDRLNCFLEEIGKKLVTKVKGYKCI